MILVMYPCAAAVDCAAILSYALEGDGICFVLDNLLTIINDHGMLINTF